MSDTIGIAWNDSYLLGNEQVDRQHKRLFEMVNDLINTSIGQIDEAKLRESLDFLIQYTVRHFHFEEELQLQYDYPEYESHKKIHEDFKVTVCGFVATLDKNGPSPEYCNELNTTVVRWLVNHVQREDRKIGIFINSCSE